MELIGFDASAVGNQEFDYGPEVLAEFLAGISKPVPFLSANLDFSAEPGLQAMRSQGRLAASAVFERQGRKIGVVGATNPRVSFISSPRGVTVKPDLAATVQGEVDALGRQGVNIILLLSQLQTLQENRSLLAEIHGVDLVIAATPLELLADPGTLLVPGDEALVVGDYPLFSPDANLVEIPIVTTGGQYRYVGRMVSTFDQAGNLLSLGEAGPVRVAGGALPDAVPADPGVTELVTTPLAQALEQRAAAVVATTEVELDATAANLLQGETNLGDLVADALLARGAALAPEFGAPVPQVALINSGGIPSDQVYPAGPLSALDLDNLLPFASFLCVVPDIPASQLKELLENSVSGVETNDGRFSQVAGLEFTWDPAGIAQQVDDSGQVTVAGTRVRSVTLRDGTPVVANGLLVPNAPAVNIATLDFTARGGDQYPYRGASFTSLGITYALALQQFLTDDLDGVVRLSDYPAGGLGRITRL
jgi:5'-nucleotidase